MRSSGEIPAAIAVDGEPRYVAVAPTGDRLYAGLDRAVGTDAGFRMIRVLPIGQP